MRVANMKTARWILFLGLAVLCVPALAQGPSGAAGPFKIEKIRANPDGYHLITISGSIPEAGCDVSDKIALHQSAGAGVEYSLSLAETGHLYRGRTNASK